MSTVPIPNSLAPETRKVAHTLESGDHLTRAEFHRRYLRMPNVKKAELIEGVVYMASPVSFRGHGQPHAIIVAVCTTYKAFTPNVFVGDNTTVRLDLDNEYQPDLCLLINPKAGGSATLDEDDYVYGPPELIVEIARSSVSIDLHQKRTVYQRAGVKEYLVWRTEDDLIDCLRLGTDGFEPVPLGNPIYKSSTFPGLWIDTVSLIKGDLAAALKVLQQGIDSPEHGQFVARLEASPKKS